MERGDWQEVPRREEGAGQHRSKVSEVHIWPQEEAPGNPLRRSSVNC